MNWSLRIGTLAGVPIKIHITFLLLILLVMLWSQNLGGFLQGVVLYTVLFGSVVLHELGHAMAARRYGIRTRDITLLPIGGVAMLERFPTNPKQEIFIAAAGPLVSFALAAASFPLALLLRGTALAPHFEMIAIINVLLGAFNLVPALPMDGGRIFRGLLALSRGRANATRIAAAVGKAFAALFVVVGLFHNPWLMMIGVFIYLGASSEGRHEATQSRMSGVLTRNVMITDFRVLTPQTQIDWAADLAIRSFQEDFPVLRAGYVLGTVSSRALQRASAEGRSLEPVAAIMKPVRRFAGPDTPLSDLIGDLHPATGGSIPVLENGALVGLVTPGRVFGVGGILGPS